MTTPGTILVAAGDAAARAALRRSLSAAGHAVCEAASARQCRTRLEEDSPDLVLFTAPIEGASLKEVVEELRAQTDRIPPFVVLAAGLNAERLDVETDGHIPWPCEERELIGLIDGFLRLQRSREVLRASEERFRLFTEAHHENERRLHAIFAGSPIGLALYDTEFRYVLVNETLARIHAVSVDEHAGRMVREVLPRSGHIVEDLLRQILETGESIHNREVSGEVGFRPGELSHFNVSYFPIPDGDGTITAFGGVVLDVTLRRRAEKDREELQDALLQAKKMESVGRLAGGVAHDFNNMLGVILGHAEIALDEVSPDQALYTDLEEIRKAAKHSADLTRQLLAFARKQSVSPKVLHLNGTVSGILKMLRRLIGENIELDWQPEEDPWSVRIDPSQVDQLLANLCVNARDSIEGGGRIGIETRNTILDEHSCSEHPGFIPGEYVQLTVTDDGCGMEPELLENVFEPFFTTKGLGKGTGLGLSTVYGIVKQNGGFITVESERGIGSSFRIFLPRCRDESQPAFADYAAEVIGGGETVLLVEDEPAILTLGKRMLSRLGYRVLAASTPVEAIGLARERGEEIDLLITDVIMPGMNGRELADHLIAERPELSVLFMSGHSADVIAHQGVLEAGVRLIQKPFSNRDLAAQVREALAEAS